MTRDRSIFIKNIYYMLSYAFLALHKEEDEKIQKESFENIHDLFAAILSLGIGRQIKQGLYREYTGRREALPVIRGKIDMPGTIRNRIARECRITCDYDELSDNNLMNQILKSTALLLIHEKDVRGQYKDLLRKEMLYFSSVEKVPDLRTIPWQNLRFQRNNQSYRTLLGICELVIGGMLMTTDAGEYRLASFVDDQHMHRLYQNFILNYYIREHPELHTSASQIPWSLDDGRDALLPIMQTDITLEDSKHSRVLIIDAKYYAHTLQSQFDRYSQHSANMYQIFTYVKNEDARFQEHPHTVSGMLLYARTEEEIQPDGVYQMSGNEISVQTLDLYQDFGSISGKLDRIAAEHFPELYPQPAE